MPGTISLALLIHWFILDKWMFIADETHPYVARRSEGCVWTAFICGLDTSNRQMLREGGSLTKQGVHVAI